MIPLPSTHYLWITLFLFYSANNKVLGIMRNTNATFSGPPGSSSSGSPSQLIQQSDNFKLPANYSKEHRPSTDGETTLVIVSVHVQAINPIKAADMDFRMDMTLTQRWTDDRLQFAQEWFDGKDYLILPLEFIDSIWHPHPFIVNAKSTDLGQLTQKLVSVYIFWNHTVQYSVNIFATVACAMNYRYYPMDSQLCPMFLESFSFDESQVKYVWGGDDAFTINKELRMLQFEPRRPLHYSEASVPRYNEARNFSQLIAYFRFDRLLGNHLIQTFAPCCLVVCLSWFSFWLELNALSARMSLLVTSILTLVTQFVGLKSDLPPVAYVKAVDIWMAGCMVWVFGALGEFVLAKVIYSMTEDMKHQYHEEHLRLFEQVGYTNNFNTDNNKRGDEEANNEENGVLENTGNNENGPSGRELRHRRVVTIKEPSGHSETNADTKSVSSISLDKRIVCGVKIPLQWTDQKTGNLVLLWKRIDDICKWVFPLTFFIFCCIYWIVLYIHRTLEDNELDQVVVSKNVSATITTM